ncbi:EutN/CcmL family microcompartment protein [Actinomycetospora cinnamomea]|uniref:Ethanolamine utilization protein EutN n=1 Tax=Actinomycetospora cinnamomea TaxID=663609 RepID=A0A2U1FIM0_9PSEU|nr:EutN/CcmL family microcompartment protein [Actinomycetospora cinnamomea]PVZ12018.1 ethanolamine utilization protein EutN [Actinomycetospora cinnamomea]
MILGEVVGRVWSEREVDGLGGARMVLVREPASGAQRVAVDLLDAGTGTTVLVATDEAAAAATGRGCVDAAVVALVAGWDGS